MYVRHGMGAVTASATVDVNLGGGSAPKTYGKSRPLLSYFQLNPAEFGALQQDDADDATLRVVNAATKIGILRSSYGWQNVAADLKELVTVLAMVKSKNKFDYQNRLGSAIAYAYDKAIEAEKAAAAANEKRKTYSQYTIQTFAKPAATTAPKPYASTYYPPPEPGLPWLWIGLGVVALGGVGYVVYKKTRKG